MKIKILKDFSIGSPPVAFQAGSEVESEDKTLIAVANRGELCKAVEEAQKANRSKRFEATEAVSGPPPASRSTKGGKS